MKEGGEERGRGIWESIRGCGRGTAWEVVVCEGYGLGVCGGGGERDVPRVSVKNMGEGCGKAGSGTGRSKLHEEGAYRETQPRADGRAGVRWSRGLG